MLRLLGAATAAMIVLSACGGGAAAPTAPAAAAGSDVTIQGFKVAPQALEVKVGTKVTWTNKDTAQHTATSGTPSAKDGKWDSGALASGAAFTFTFTQAGTFSYFCTVHPTTSGLMGTIVVK